jgi:spore coat polysaccharide biosynthesis protein SpsF
MKNIGIIILSRYSSTRLPGKALIEINGTTLLGNIINNIKLNLPEVKCIVATSIHKSDDIIEKFCKNNLTNYFRGDLNNVAKRFLECSIKYKLDIAVRINGDNFS